MPLIVINQIHIVWTYGKCTTYKKHPITVFSQKRYGFLFVFLRYRFLMSGRAFRARNFSISLQNVLKQTLQSLTRSAK